MNLYHVQDEDRPMYVIAPHLASAIHKWKCHIACENDIEREDVEEPHGVSLVCEKGDLLVR